MFTQPWFRLYMDNLRKNIIKTSELLDFMIKIRNLRWGISFAIRQFAETLRFESSLYYLLTDLKSEYSPGPCVQQLEQQPTYRSFSGSIPVKGTGFRVSGSNPDPSRGPCGKQPIISPSHCCFILSLSLAPLPSTI